MYAIIEACGRQYKVEKGMEVFFEKLDVEEGKKVTFDKVILISDEGKVEVGNPTVAGAKVEGKVISNGRGKKVLVYKYKPKKNERKIRGHRQDYTKVEITSIKTAVEKKVAAKAETTDKAEKTTKTTKSTAKQAKTTKTAKAEKAE